jgi:hypothetical protein
MRNLATTYRRVLDRRAAAIERAVEDHQRWIRKAWPDHVRNSGGRGRIPTASEIIADGDHIGWRAWGDPSRSRARYEPIREAFEPLRLADLRDRLRRAQERP